MVRLPSRRATLLVQLSAAHRQKDERRIEPWGEREREREDEEGTHRCARSRSWPSTDWEMLMPLTDSVGDTGRFCKEVGGGEGRVFAWT